METNDKLTDTIKGRRISGTQNQGDSLKISFTDGSQLTIKTAGSSNSASTGGTITAVRKERATLYLDMEDGSTFAVATPENSSGVVVRGGDGATEYAD